MSARTLKPERCVRTRSTFSRHGSTQQLCRGCEIRSVTSACETRLQSNSRRSFIKSSEIAPALNTFLRILTYFWPCWELRQVPHRNERGLERMPFFKLFNECQRKSGALYFTYCSLAVSRNFRRMRTSILICCDV